MKQFIQKVLATATLALTLAFASSASADEVLSLENFESYNTIHSFQFSTASGFDLLGLAAFSGEDGEAFMDSIGYNGTDSAVDIAGSGCAVDCTNINLFAEAFGGAQNSGYAWGVSGESGLAVQTQLGGQAASLASIELLQTGGIGTIDFTVTTP